MDHFHLLITRHRGALANLNWQCVVTPKRKRERQRVMSNCIISIVFDFVGPNFTGFISIWYDDNDYYDEITTTSVTCHNVSHINTIHTEMRWIVMIAKDMVRTQCMLVWVYIVYIEYFYYFNQTNENNANGFDCRKEKNANEWNDWSR